MLQRERWKSSCGKCSERSQDHSTPSSMRNRRVQYFVVTVSGVQHLKIVLKNPKKHNNNNKNKRVLEFRARADFRNDLIQPSPFSFYTNM